MLTRNAFPVCAGTCACVCACVVCVCVCVFRACNTLTRSKIRSMVYLKLTFTVIIHDMHSYRQSVNSKTIKSVTMLSQSGFWLKSVQSETSECSTLPRHVSH